MPRGGWVAFAVCMATGLAFWAAVIWVAVHFVANYW
jgi:hypothetical protein